MLGIVGPTGSGKTTLINLILRFYDSPPASIMIDGVDIREFSFKTLRNHMALVSQDTLLFNDTLKNNIIYGLDREVTEKELIDTLQKARLQEFILSLPKGLDTSIGDKGIRLSGGERQRLSIARALLKNADILILDEASSSLDTKTEIFIQQAIEELMRGRTVICIAHRLSTIKGMDKIIVIEGGMLKEEGSLLELLEKKGKFALIVWPYHAMLGGVGHALTSVIEEAIRYHGFTRKTDVEFEVKGGNPFTENYSVLSPEVLTTPSGAAIASRNTKFIERLLGLDVLIIAGQAKSHCVAWSIQDLLDDIAVKDPALAQKVYLLEDATSPVITPYMDFTKDANDAFDRSVQLVCISSKQLTLSIPGRTLQTKYRNC